MTDYISGKTVITFKDHFDWFITSKHGLKISFIMGAALGVFLFIDKYFFEQGELIIALVMAFFGLVFVPLFSFPVNLLIQSLGFRRLTSKQRQIEWVIDKTSLKLSDETGNTIVTPWNQVDRIVLKRKGVLIFQKPTCSRWIPNRVFGAENMHNLTKMASDYVK